MVGSTATMKRHRTERVGWTRIRDNDGNLGTNHRVLLHERVGVPAEENKDNKNLLTTADLIRECRLHRTSMIGLCQEAKSSPDALREERWCKFFSAFSASCWPLGDGFYSRIEQTYQ